jgi:hypothetical protein
MAKMNSFPAPCIGLIRKWHVYVENCDISAGYRKEWVHELITVACPCLTILTGLQSKLLGEMAFNSRSKTRPRQE